MDALLYIGSALTGIWGISHLFATRGVVKGFGPLTEDNRRIITMEWIVEGVALVSVAVLVAAVTAVDSSAAAAAAAYAAAVGTLIVLAIVSLFTGFKIKFWPFRLCPAIFTASAILIALGAWL